MSIFDELFPKDLYHSYIIEGDPENIPKELISFLEKRLIIEPKSSELLCQIYDAFTISDSPTIKSWHSELGFKDKKRVCILSAKFINQEAEHSLLKIFEEPAINTHFFLVVPNASVLLPTILSRAHVIRSNNGSLEGLVNLNKKVDGKKFVDASPKERIDFIADIIKFHIGDEDSSLVRFDAIDLLNNIEKVLHKRLASDHSKDLQFSLKEINNCRGYLSLPGCSVKMLLEHIALVI